jgi:hypothetical protein
MAEKVNEADYPCHALEKEKWCDLKGSGDFMGHTCNVVVMDPRWNFIVAPRKSFIHGDLRAANLGEAQRKLRLDFPEREYDMVILQRMTP